jgi:hypothetical protein
VTTGGNADVAISVYLAEYESLRREIEMRATLSSSLVALELSALGIGLVAATNLIDLYAGLAFLSTILWLFWLDHTEQIWKLACYISLELRPLLVAAAPGSLGWERFLRSLDSRRVVRSTKNAAFYISLLFASMPPILGGIFVAAALHSPLQSGLPLAGRLLVAVVIYAFWIYALLQFRIFSASRNQMDAWIQDPATF